MPVLGPLEPATPGHHDARLGERDTLRGGGRRRELHERELLGGPIRLDLRYLGCRRALLERNRARAHRDDRRKPEAQPRADLACVHRLADLERVPRRLEIRHVGRVPATEPRCEPGTQIASI